MRDKVLYNNAENEILRLMTFTVLKDIANNINKSFYYFIIADEITVVIANKSLSVLDGLMKAQKSTRRCSNFS